MSKILLSSVMILLLGVLIFTGCAEPAITPTTVPATTTAPSPTTAPTPTFEWPNDLKIITNASGTNYDLTVAWAPVLEKTTGMKVRVTPEDLATLRWQPVKEGEYQVCTQTSTDAVFCLEGIGGFLTRDGGPWQLRVLWPVKVSAFTFMVRGDSDIKEITDLKPGVKLAVPPGDPPRISALALCYFAGLEEEDVNVVEFGSMDAAVRAVPEGQADIVYWIPNSPISFELEETPGGIRWLDLDPNKYPDGAERFLERKPTSVIGKPPQTAIVESAKGIYFALSPTYYFVGENTDIELVYNLCKWFDENYDAYKDLHKESFYLQLDTYREILNTTFLPIHEGAIRYLKEKGVWTADDDKRQAYNLDLTTKYVTAYMDAIAEADKKGIQVDPENEDWVKIWAEYKKDIPGFRVMFNIP
jgi:TRAP transporter TAXI family solute receptor